MGLASSAWGAGEHSDHHSETHVDGRSVHPPAESGAKPPPTPTPSVEGRIRGLREVPGLHLLCSAHLTPPTVTADQGPPGSLSGSFCKQVAE